MPRGKPFTDAQIESVIFLESQKISVNEIAKIFGVHRMTISRLRKRKKYLKIKANLVDYIGKASKDSQ